MQVLIVEDEPMLGLYLRHLLEELGYVPLGPAADASKAQQLLAGSAPFAAILDLHGTAAAGPLLDELRARGIAIVVCSGVSEHEVPDELTDAVFVPKPIDEGQLASSLARLRPTT